MALAASEFLEAGNEDKARPELRCALVLDPKNAIALNLSRQMTADPQATLGRDSFAYTVKAGDTLALLAQRFLKDNYSFYILARYNDIKVPRQLAVGQVIRIPGKAPPPPPPPPSTLPPPPPPAPPRAPPPPPISAGAEAMGRGAALERAGDPLNAWREYVKARGLGEAGAAAKVEQLTKPLVDRYSRVAREAEARHDLIKAIGSWETVLEIEPQNEFARDRRAEDRRLLEIVRGLPSDKK